MWSWENHSSTLWPVKTKPNWSHFKVSFIHRHQLTLSYCNLLCHRNIVDCDITVHCCDLTMNNRIVTRFAMVSALSLSCQIYFKMWHFSLVGKTWWNRDTRWSHHPLLRLFASLIYAQTQMKRSHKQGNKISAPPPAWFHERNVYHSSVGTSR